MAPGKKKKDKRAHGNNLAWGAFSSLPVSDLFSSVSVATEVPHPMMRAWCTLACFVFPPRQQWVTAGRWHVTAPTRPGGQWGHNRWWGALLPTILPSHLTAKKLGWVAPIIYYYKLGVCRVSLNVHKHYKAQLKKKKLYKLYTYITNLIKCAVNTCYF